MIHSDCHKWKRMLLPSGNVWYNTKKLSQTKSAQNQHQAIRWINYKEHHCDHIIKTVSDYFLCQRVKESNFANSDEYSTCLIRHHKVLVCAMKAKQSVDEKVVTKLNQALRDIRGYYHC